MDSSVVLPLPEGPISSVSSPPFSARLTPLSAATLASAAAKLLRQVHRLKQWFGYRVNTTAGSMRVTWTIAAIEDPMHITRVTTNSPAYQFARDDDRQRRPRGQPHDGVAGQRGEARSR